MSQSSSESRHPSTACVAWVDGAVVDTPAARVSALAEGLTLGRGVFTTLTVVSGRPLALQRHLRRLIESAPALGLHRPSGRLMEAAVDEVVSAPQAAALLGDQGVGRLKVLWVAGRPGADGAASGQLVVTLTAQPPWPETTTAATVDWVRNERSSIVGIKTTSYAENLVARAEAVRRGASEALLANTRGELCEGTASNVFVIVGGEVLTPPLSSGCLPGIARALVLATGLAREAVLPMAVLSEVDEVFLTSSTRHVHPVASLDGRTLTPAGPLTRACSAAYADIVAREQ